ncbi:protein spinster isoform X2 [Cylas formicarius]|uniref:protein spinster isoform X2 n=1 Tax=Cylas formicarius TaxID=197179 RepID=UPI002958C2D7|nr:protein spinster isoform X2 [Cylas formicarius]
MPSEKLEKGSKIVLKKLNIMEQNNSHSDLVRDGDEIEQNERTLREVSWKEWVSVSVLCYVNLINYMDRFTLAGVLEEIQTYFGVNDGRAGLLQTAFVVSYMAFGPLFGYLGDRYSRRWLMSFGVFLWSVTTLCGSFMQNYWWFLLFRSLVGIGEASYSTIAPTIISDLFVGDIRSKMLALFYFAIPVGSGLGYIVGSETASLAGSWHWALRVTPALGLVAVFMIVVFLEEPERGASEGNVHMEATSWGEDIKELLKNKSYILSTAGFTCVSFVAGALAWWGPKFIEKGLNIQGNPGAEDSVSFRFGIVAMISGLIGVPTGSYLAQRLRHRVHRIDAYICGFGLLLSSPFVFFAIFSAKYSAPVCFTMVFFGEFFLNLTWSIVADILLYVVLPIRRSTAEGFQLLVSHALGDAGSPYLVGVLSEAYQIMLRGNDNVTTPMNVTLTPQDSDTTLIEFKALQYALFTACFVEILGGFLFLFNAFFIVEDKEKVERAIHGNSQRLLINEDLQST